MTDAGIPTVIETPITDAKVGGLSQIDLMVLDDELEATAAAAVRRSRRRMAAALVLLIAFAVGVVVVVQVSTARWEHAVAVRTVSSAAAELRASATGNDLPDPEVASGVGGVAAVVPKLSTEPPDALGELGYQLGDDGRASLTAASRTTCVTVWFSVKEPPSSPQVTDRDGPCELPEL